VIITSRSDADLERDLRESLTILLNPSDYADAGVIEDVPLHETAPPSLFEISAALDAL